MKGTIVLDNGLRFPVEIITNLPATVEGGLLTQASVLLELGESDDEPMTEARFRELCGSLWTAGVWTVPTDGDLLKVNKRLFQEVCLLFARLTPEQRDAHFDAQWDAMDWNEWINDKRRKLEKWGIEQHKLSLDGGQTDLPPGRTAVPHIPDPPPAPPPRIVGLASGEGTCSFDSVYYPYRR